MLLNNSRGKGPIQSHSIRYNFGSNQKFTYFIWWCSEFALKLWENVTTPDILTITPVKHDTAVSISKLSQAIALTAAARSRIAPVAYQCARASVMWKAWERAGHGEVWTRKRGIVWMIWSSSFALLWVAVCTKRPNLSHRQCNFYRDPGQFCLASSR